MKLTKGSMDLAEKLQEEKFALIKEMKNKKPELEQESCEQTWLLLMIADLQLQIKDLNGKLSGHLSQFQRAR